MLACFPPIPALAWLSFIISNFLVGYKELQEVNVSSGWFLIPNSHSLTSLRRSRNLAALFQRLFGACLLACRSRRHSGLLCTPLDAQQHLACHSQCHACREIFAIIVPACMLPGHLHTTISIDSRLCTR